MDTVSAFKLEVRADKIAVITIDECSTSETFR